MNIEDLLQKYKISPDILKDQFFLTDERIIRKSIELAEVNGNDVVLEIGAGIGNLTSEIAKYAKKVIALEIDEKFEPIISKLPDNVEVHYGDAHIYASQGGKVRKKKEFNKVVSNIPYNIAEWLLHNLAFVEYDKTVLLVPKKFVYKIEENPVFRSFYKLGEKIEVDKSKFYPQPRTNSMLIDLLRLENPLVTRDLALFLRQYIYQREGWKVKNSLREGLITYVRRIYRKRLTKNSARKIIEDLEIKNKLLNNTPDNAEIYQQISEELNEDLLKNTCN